MVWVFVTKYILASSSGQSVNLCSDVVQNLLLSSPPQQVHLFRRLSIISRYPKCILHSLGSGLNPSGIVFGSGNCHPQYESGIPVYGLIAPRFMQSFVTRLLGTPLWGPITHPSEFHAPRQHVQHSGQRPYVLPNSHLPGWCLQLVLEFFPCIYTFVLQPQLVQCISWSGL